MQFFKRTALLGPPIRLPPVIFAMLTVCASLISILLPATAQTVEPPSLTVRKHFRLAPFYRQWVDVEGLPVVASEKVNPYALKETAWLIRRMIGHRPEVLRAMAKNRVRVSVMAYHEMTTRIPEHSDLSPGFYWDRRARGLGATPIRKRGLPPPGSVARKNAFLAMIALTVLAGCKTSGKNMVGDDSKSGIVRKDSCEPVSGRLSMEATMANRTGNYRLTLVEPAFGSDGRSVRGTLTLRESPEGLDSLGSASTPLYGFTDVNIKAVGAHRVGSLLSEDPQSPGVLVLEGNYTGERNILLRLGSTTNQRDLRRYDGAYTVLDVHEISVNGFAGSWRSATLKSGTKGYFCAKKVFQD